MVRILLLILSTLFVGAGPKDWSKYSRLDVEEYLIKQQKIKGENDYRNLMLAKYYLISGQIFKSRIYLSKINAASTLYPVRLRYLSYIDFIEGNYEKSYFHLSSLTSYSDQSETCALRMINLLILGNIKELEDQSGLCEVVNRKFITNENLWNDYLISIKNRHKYVMSGLHLSEGDFFYGSNELLKIWFKMGIYLGHEKQILKNLYLIPYAAYQSHSIRELMALTYYRTGNNKKALEYVEDITTPNAENIKGNILMEKKQYELAFGHFQLALLKKENSKNALERALPLSWKLEQWERGLKTLSLYVDDGINERKKLALNTAFHIRLGNFKRAQKHMRELLAMYQGRLPKELISMNMYVAFENFDYKIVKRTALEGCKKNDPISCWLMGQNLVWEDLTHTFKRDEKTFEEENLSIESLADASQITPIDEPEIIEQKNIEEMDSESISNKILLDKKKI